MAGEPISEIPKGIVTPPSRSGLHRFIPQRWKKQPSEAQLPTSALTGADTTLDASSSLTIHKLNTDSTVPISGQTLPESENVALNDDIIRGIETRLNGIPDLVNIGIIPKGYDVRLGLQFLERTSANAVLTDNRRRELEGQIKEGITDNLGNGLEHVIQSTTRKVSQGMLFGIDDGHKKVAEFYSLANEAGIPLGISPILPLRKDTRDNLPVPTLTTEAQVHKYLDERINEQLPQGLQREIEDIGRSVGLGLLKSVSNGKTTIDDIIQTMEQRGFTIVNREPAAPIEGSEQPGIIPREINRQEIQRLIDEQIRDNLAKGIESNMDSTRFKLQKGMPHPLSYFSPEIVTLFRTEGDKYGVVDTNLSTLTEDNKFNPELIEEEVVMIVRGNIEEGFESLRVAYAREIEEGKISIANVSLRTLDEFIELAHGFGISIDEAEIRRKMAEQATPERVQKGIQAMIKSLKEDLQKGNFTFADLSKKQIEQVKDFVHLNGLEGAVNEQPLLTAYEEAGIELPQLAEYATSS